MRWYTTWATKNAIGISWWKRKSESEDEQVEDKCDDGKRHTNICQQHSDRKRWEVHLSGTKIQHKRITNHDKEIHRKITAGLTAFAKHRDIFKGNIGRCLKRQVYNSCIFPATTYGAETRALTTHAKNKLAAAKKKRSMLNITYRERKTNIWVREKTTVKRQKWTCAGHVGRIRDNRWKLRITT